MPLQLCLALYAVKVRAAKTLLEGIYGTSSVRSSTATSAAGCKHTSVCISAPFGKMVDERSGLPLGPPTTMISYAARSFKNTASSSLFIVTVCGK